MNSPLENNSVLAFILSHTEFEKRKQSRSFRSMKISCLVANDYKTPVKNRNINFDTLYSRRIIWQSKQIKQSGESHVLLTDGSLNDILKIND